MAGVSLWDQESVIIRELMVEFRNEAQLTQSQLAKMLNRPQSYVSKYESGEKQLTLPEIEKIVQHCGRNLKDFVFSYMNELERVKINE
ncbi:helix-turn-helix domain-containing protein [Yunchengibacter salinarum]|uniref:helix-turn-helix domain-containing protein n=1 Tax=Yunchengibacter salinarum TaxID=3133399 RepID=UPI0035B5C4A6